jgi:hypothetical protein
LNDESQIAVNAAFEEFASYLRIPGFAQGLTKNQKRV